MGTVANVDITIPSLALTEMETRTEANRPTRRFQSRRRALATKVAASIGSPEKLKSIHSLQSTFTLTQKTPQGDLKMPAVATVVFPDHMHVDNHAEWSLRHCGHADAGFMSARRARRARHAESRNRESLETN